MTGGEQARAWDAVPDFLAFHRGVCRLRGEACVLRLEEGDAARGREPDDHHHREQRIALPRVPDHLAERARQRERDEQDQEDLENVGERIRVLERVRRVGVEETATVVPHLLDDLLRGHRAADHGLVLPSQRGDGVRRGEVVDDAARHQDQRSDERQRQQQPQRAPGQVHPEVAEPVGLAPHEPPDQRDGDRDADGRGGEVLHRQAAHLDDVAHRGLAGVVLPVGVGGERGGRVPRQGRRHPGEPEREHQVVLYALQQVDGQHGHDRERQHAAEVGAPLLVRVRVDTDGLVDPALYPPVLLRSEHPGHVVAQWLVADRQGEHEQANLKPAGRCTRHQNFSGKIRATTR